MTPVLVLLLAAVVVGAAVAFASLRVPVLDPASPRAVRPAARAVERGLERRTGWRMFAARAVQPARRDRTAAHRRVGRRRAPRRARVPGPDRSRHRPARPDDRTLGRRRGDRLVERRDLGHHRPRRHGAPRGDRCRGRAVRVGPDALRAGVRVPRARDRRTGAGVAAHQGARRTGPPRARAARRARSLVSERPLRRCRRDVRRLRAAPRSSAIAPGRRRCSRASASGSRSPSARHVCCSVCTGSAT